MPKGYAKGYAKSYAVTYAKAYSNDISLAQVFGIREKHNLKQTKKAKSFQLFSEVKTPSSAEIKTIGLYKTNRYKYFYEW